MSERSDRLAREDVDPQEIDRERRFLEVLDRSWNGPRDPAALDAAAGGDPVLRQRLERAFRIAASGEELRLPALPADGFGRPAERAPSLEPGTRIGSYRITRLLGEGGMGSVYEAEQESPRRRVALKILPPGLASAGILRRFRYETEALARLQHPGIALIHEAAVADLPGGSSPFFAMELVAGEHLDVAALALDRDERLRVFVKLCEAVEHAHQRGIVHRDLKPANILVDEDGQPKVLDFGVARAQEPEGHETLHRMDAEQVLGTLAYMSPEQANGAVERVDARTDVYSLGVILYQLLAGKLPIEVPKQFSLGALKRIAEVEPESLARVDPALAGDLEWIAATAMAKDRERRYPSAAALAEDVEHHLAGEAVLARPPTVSYRLTKFARRHRGPLAGVAIAVLVAAAATAVSWRYASAEARERELATERVRAAEQRTTEALARAAVALREATDEAVKTAALTEFATDLLRTGQPGEEGRDVTVAELLTREELRLEEVFADQPEVRAELQLSIGVVRRARSEFDSAQELLTAAYETRRDVLGPDALATAEAREELGLLCLERGDVESAARHLRGSLEVHERELGAGHRRTLRSCGNLAQALLLLGQLDEAESLLQSTLDTQRELFGAGDEDLLATLDALGHTAILREDFARAIALFRDEVALSEELHGPDHATTLTARSNLVVALQGAGQFVEAEALILDLVDAAHETFGPESREGLLATINHAVLLHGLRRYAEAEALLRPAIEIEQRVLGEDHIDTLRTRHSLAAVLLDQRELDEAIGLFEDVHARQLDVLGATHVETRQTLENLVRALHARGELELATERLAELALAHEEAGDAAEARLAETQLEQWSLALEQR